MTRPTIIRAQDVRATTTAGGTMTTLASPSLGGTQAHSLWRVSMTAGQAGPEHVIDSEQLWMLETGSAELTLDGTQLRLDAGMTLAIPGGARRRVATNEGAEFIVCGSARALASVPGAEAAPVTPPWIA